MSMSVQIREHQCFAELSLSTWWSVRRIESKGDDLCCNPDPTPFSSPVHPDGPAPNLFLGANTQSHYFDTSDDELEFDKDIAVPYQVHQRSTQPSHSGPIPHLDFCKLPPAQTPHLPPTEDILIIHTRSCPCCRP